MAKTEFNSQAIAAHWDRLLGMAHSWEAKLSVLDWVAQNSELASRVLAQPAAPPSPREFGLSSPNRPPLPGFDQIEQLARRHQALCGVALFVMWSVLLFALFHGRAWFTAILCAPAGGVMAGLTVGLARDAFSAAARRTPQIKAHTAYCTAVAHHARVERIRDAFATAMSAKPWLAADGPLFEKLVARHFRGQGWAVEIVGGANDGGVDIKMERAGRRIIVQCKAHARPISPAVVRELYGALGHHRCHGAYLATLHGVTPKALEWTQDKPITVLQLKDFVAGL